MANEFIARKGIISLDGAQVTGSLSVTGNISASIFTGSFVGDGSQLSGIEGFPFTGSAGITGSLTVVGPVNATTFTGDGSQLTGIEGFPFTGSAGISGSLTVVGPVNATSFTGSLQGTATSASYIQLANVDGFTAYSASVNTAIDSVLDATTPLTATVNTTNTPFTLTSQSIVVADSTNGNLTIRLPDLNAIVGTPNQKPIIVYKNDYSQNVIYVQPSGSQLVNGASQDIIVSIQLAVIYNPTSAGWVTEGTSAQSLAELELFFLPLTETGSLATTGSNTFRGNQIVTGSLTVTGGINATITGSATSASYVEYVNVANKPALVSSSAQIVGYNIFATTGSNQFNGSQAITGSLTVTGQVVAQTLNVQQVTSSIVYSSGSNVFGNSLGNTQQFTGSLQVSGSSHYVLGNVGISTITPQTPLQILRDTTGNGTSIEESNMAFTVLSAAGQSKISIGASNAGNYGYVQVMQDATSWTNRNLVLQPRGGNVGIGTYTPLDTFTDRTVLTINGTTNGAFLNFGSSGTLNAFIQSNTSGFQIGSQANIPVEIRVNGSNALVLAASGGAATFTSSVGINGVSATYPLYVRTGTNQRARFVDNGGLFQFGVLNDAENTYSDLSLGNSAIVIKAAGNVGIGTTSPGQKLEVVGGEIKAGRVDSSNEGGQLSFGRASDNATAWYIDAFGNTSSPQLRFVNVSDSAVVMTMSGGNIGIGTTDLTSTRLRIKSSTTGSSNFVLYTEDSAANILFWVRDDGYINTGSRTSSPYNLTSGNAANMVVGADGTLYRSTSSLKYKTDIRNYTKGLNEVLGLRPVFYKGKTDGDTQFAGLIAEEVHELGLTEFVQYAPDGSPDALSYQNMIALAFKAIQEQQSQIESLKAEIQTLKQ
jgi:hypothetical protein